jgi:lipoprotein-anchoring transpeptidase ErfK/SrfK
VDLPDPQPAKVIKIDLAQQTVETYLGSELVHHFDCVSGDDGHPTDPGMFAIMRKHHPYRSHTYDIQMNYALFFTLDGKALHQYHGPLPLSWLRALRSKLGTWFGSHGCVRLEEDHAKALFDWAPVGTTVQVF